MSSAAVGHGKVILLGEHAVVHGVPAIAVGIPRGCHATAERALVDTLSVEPWGVTVQAQLVIDEPEERAMLRRAFTLLCERLSTPRPALAVHAVMEIPGGAGLGGSAALSVAIIRAQLAALGLAQDATDDARIIAASHAWECVFHGNPSGVDSAMATRGGLALYRKGEALEPLPLRRELVLVVGYSGDHGSTKTMVESVARQLARDPEKTQQIFDAIAALVNNARSALAQGEYARLGQLFDLNQKLLNTLMLSTTKLEIMCNLARDAGALGAKLTGGGGGGSMIALAEDATHAQPIALALRNAGFEAFVVQVGGST